MHTIGSSSGVPYGDYFVAHARQMFTELEPGVVQHHCEADMHWTKSTWLKGRRKLKNSRMFDKISAIDIPIQTF